MASLHPPASPTLDLIQEWYRQKGIQDEERTYLGASVLGDPCERKLWFQFRWAYEPEIFSGQMIRLFQTGHLQEERMIDDLRNAGCEVIDKLDDGGQIAVKFADGHGGGHLDGEVSGLVEAPKAMHVLECKTHGLKSWKQLVKDGVLIAKPQHYAQMQVYMHLRGHDRAVYMAVCKDSDELYIERIHYDENMARLLMDKARRITQAHDAPERISDNPDYYLCKWCPFQEQCHQQDAPVFARRNCRTCLHVTPTYQGRWECGFHKKDVSTEEQRNGCGKHVYLPDLVPGECLDADEDANTVTYRLPSGVEFIDGGK